LYYYFFVYQLLKHCCNLHRSTPSNVHTCCWSRSDVVAHVPSAANVELQVAEKCPRKRHSPTTRCECRQNTRPA